MSDTHRIISLTDAPAIPATGDTPAWVPVRRRLGIGAFGTNAYRADAGDLVIERHIEEPPGPGMPAHEELYLVVAGAATFTIGDDEVAAPHGTAVFLPDPDVQRSAVATQDGTVVLAIGAPPGGSFSPSAWEAEWLQRAGEPAGPTGPAER